MKAGKKLARWHPVQKSYLRFKFHDNIATYKLYVTLKYVYDRLTGKHPDLD